MLLVPVKCPWADLLRAHINASEGIYDIHLLNQILVYFVVAFQRHTHTKQPMYPELRQFIVTCIDDIIPAEGPKKFQFIQEVLKWACDTSTHRWQDHLVDDFNSFNVGNK